MELNTLTAISPVDGRYRKQVHHLDEYFSEYALIRYRVLIEIEYLLFLQQKKFFKLPGKTIKFLQKLAENLGPEDAQEIKQIEFTTNHDVKAVEYFLKSELEKNGGAIAKEWVHFGLTSQDINNTAIPLSWKHAIEYEYLPGLLNLNAQLKLLAEDWMEIPMLAHVDACLGNLVVVIDNEPDSQYPITGFYLQRSGEGLPARDGKSSAGRCQLVVIRVFCHTTSAIAAHFGF